MSDNNNDTTFQEDMIRDIERIKNFADQALQTMKCEESSTKYKLILDEMDEISREVSKLKSHAHIEIQLRYKGE